MRLRWALLAVGAVALAAAPSAAGDDRFGAAAVRAAIERGELDALRRDAEEELTRLLMHDMRQPDEMERFIRIAAVRQFALHFDDITTGDDDASKSARVRTLHWLTGRPRLFRVLALALEPENDPADVLDVVAALRRAEGDALERFAELATAFAVVWDDPPDAPRAAGESGAQAVELFQYYVRGHDELRYDLTRMPWDLSVYLAEGQAPVEQYRWARSQHGYRSRPTRTMGQVYFDVPYDDAGLYTGQWQGVDGQPYTLANLRSAGGVCKDQAYFAAHVNRAFGVPAVICAGRSGRGVGYHAWIGYLKPDGDGAVWDFNTARYAEHRYWSASVEDPQTRREMSDGDVSARGQLFGVPARERLWSTAIVRTAELIDAERKAALLERAIDTSPGNLAAWWALADHYGGEGADTRDVAEMVRTIGEFTRDRYDEFGFELFTRTIQGLPGPAQLRLVARNQGMFAHRPDLQSRLEILQGRLMAQMDNTPRALARWTRVARRSHDYPPVLLEATDRIDALLREQDQVERLVVVYRTIWGRLSAPEPSGYAWTTPWFLVGQKYAQALEDTGDRAAARRVRDLLDERDTRQANGRADTGP